MKTIIGVRGKSCPIPVGKEKEALENIACECMDIYVDNVIAVQNTGRLAQQKGYQFASEQESVVIRL